MFEKPFVLNLGRIRFWKSNYRFIRSQWKRGLRSRYTAALLLRLWVRIPPGAWMFVCCQCCVLSGRCLCGGLITRPEDSYRLWCVVVCDQESSKTRSLKPATGLWKIQPQWVVTPGKQTTNKQWNWEGGRTLYFSLVLSFNILRRNISYIDAICYTNRHFSASYN
jgi:hypothetical protein